MNFRVTDNSANARSLADINTQRTRLGALQERLTSGKKINRPSDDPAGAEAVINLKTSQTEIEQFKKNATVANQKLTATDDSLNSYQNLLTRLKTLVAQGLSDTTTPTARNSVATEIESLRSQILNVANGKNNGEFLFGGTRQNVAPFDPATAAPAAQTATAQFIQIEPGANAIAVGATGETVFADSTGTIFNDLDNAVTALRGTGNAAADKATLQNSMSRLGVYDDLAKVAQGRVGANMNYAETAQDQLASASQSLDDRISSIEKDDFAETALEYTQAQTSLNATLQATAQSRKSLFDYLG